MRQPESESLFSDAGATFDLASLSPLDAERLCVIRECWDSLTSGSCEGRPLNDLYRESLILEDSLRNLKFVHQVEAAAQFNRYLDFLVQFAKELNDDKLDQGALLLEQLERAASQPLPDLKTLERAAPAAAGRDETTPLIYLVNDEGTFFQDLLNPLRFFGYDARRFRSLAEASWAAQVEIPAAVVMNIPTNDASLQGFHDMRGFADACSAPTVFLAPRNDIEARLEAVRAGGAAYLVKPVDIVPLVEKLDSVTRREPTEPYRALIIDNSEALANYYAAILEREGFLVWVLQDPMETLNTMDDFQPDTILLDLDVSPCGGVDLARVLRQEERWAGVSIAFLAPQAIADEALECHKATGEDILARPLLPQELLSEVSAMARRSRLIRAMSIRDGLTGLFNRSVLKENLEREIRRCRRYSAKLSFAILDIDRLGLVNQSFGHHAGDSVLRSLARLLRKRLRATDILGRLTGGTFAAILPDADSASARTVIDEIRRDFAAISHSGYGQDFRSSFTAGVSTLPPAQDSVVLLENAEKALATAKREGKNRVRTWPVESPPPAAPKTAPMPRPTATSTSPGVAPARSVGDAIAPSAPAAPAPVAPAPAVSPPTPVLPREAGELATGIAPFRASSKEAIKEDLATSYLEPGREVLGQIVLIDDDANLSKLLKRRLEEAGYEVFPFNNGETAIQWIQTNSLDLVITDLLLPRIHGFEICRRIKSNTHFSRLPVILMTGVYTSMKFEFEGKNLGADAFIRKPIDFNALIAKIAELLAARQ